MSNAFLSLRRIGSLNLGFAALTLLTVAAGSLHAQTQLIALSPSALAFPVTVKGKPSAPLTVTVTSTGNTAVTFTSFAIAGADPADFAITANTCGASLASGASCQVSITFTPAVTGALTANLTITDNATNSPQKATLSGSGSNIVFTLRPAAITFPVVTVGSTSTSQVTATNIGIASATISSIAITGADASDFVIGTKTCGTTLAAGASCTVNVTFKPTVNGVRTSNLSFTDNAAQSPQFVPLTGTAQAPTQTLIFSPSSLVFAPTDVGTLGVVSTTVTNFGSIPVTFSGVSLTGPNPSDFFTITSCPPLVSTASCNLSVGFRPAGPGLRTAVLLVADSAPGSPHSVPLSGTGIASGSLLNLSTTALSFPPENVGTSTNMSFTIQNLGTAGAFFSSFSITGRNAADFAITSNSCPSGTTQLVAPQACTVGVTFTPSGGGVRVASLSITDSAIGSPQVIALSGTGQAISQLLTFSTSNLTFGAQTIGTNTGTSSVTVGNAGDATVNFSNIVIGGNNPGDFSIAYENCVPGGTIAPGGTCTVQLTFTPTAAGVRSATLTFTDNAAGSPQVLILEGVGDTAIQQLSFNYANYDFGVLDIGATSSQITVYVNNYGDSPVSFTNVVVSGTNAPDFSITSDTCLSPTPLNPTATCAISLNFSPSATGLRTAQLMFTDSANGSPQSVGLSGYGQVLTQTVIFGSPSFVFPAQTIGTPSAQMSDYFQNTGDSPIIISSVSIVGGNAGDFAISGDQCPIGGAGVGAYGGYCYVYITFTPSATGLRTSTLQFVDSATGSPRNLPLVGVGNPAVVPLNINPTDVGFNNQNVGTTSAAANINVSNPGGTALSLSVALTGTNAADFTILTNNCPVSLGSGAGCTVSVTFRPSALGTRVAALQFTAGGTPLSVGLSGIGTTAAKVLTTQQLALDFGPVNIASTSNQIYVQITNTGTLTVTFSGFALGGANPADFTISNNQCGSTLTVGASCNVYLTFTPKAAGVRTAALLITDDAMGSPQSVPLDGIGQTPTMILDLPTPYYFPAVNVGMSVSQYQYFYNVGTAPVTFTSLSITGANAADFAVGQTTCTGSINPAGSCYIYVTFAPTAAGVRSASLQLTDNATGSPQSVPLSGIGQNPIKTLVLPQAITLPITTVGQSSTNATYFYISNTGNATVTFSSVTITGANSSDFSFGSTSCGTTLAGASSCYYYINFTPSAAGLRTASVQFTDDAVGSPQSVALSGVGRVSTMTLSLPAAITLPTTNLGATTSSSTYYVYNTGTNTVTVTTVAVTGTNASEFAIGGGSCISGASIPPASYCSLYVNFTPLAAGNRTAAIQFTDNAVGSPQSIPLNGVAQGITLTASIDPSLLSYGQVTVGTSSGAQNTYLYNTGDSPITISGTFISGANASDYVLNSTSCTAGTVINPGSYCYLQVTFTPTAKGVRTAAVQVTDNATGGTQSAMLTGIGG